MVKKDRTTKKISADVKSNEESDEYPKVCLPRSELHMKDGLFNKSIRDEESDFHVFWNDSVGEFKINHKLYWPMKIIVNGAFKVIEVDSSWTAGVISGYQYAVDQFIVSYKLNELLFYTGKSVIDSYGHPYYLDTDPARIRTLQKLPEDQRYSWW